MRRTRLLSFLLALALVLPLLARAGEVKDLDDLLKKNKTSIQKAADEATKASPGTVVAAKLFKNLDDGNPTWRVLVLKGETMTEVYVDGTSAKAVVKGSWKDETEAEKARSPKPGEGD
ncbi:hypothetical protein HY251_06175 [bacterium]|nr:hypothetical protein [bacterium]